MQFYKNFTKLEKVFIAFHLMVIVLCSNNNVQQLISLFPASYKDEHRTVFVFIENIAIAKSSQYDYRYFLLQYCFYKNIQCVAK